MLEPWIAIDIGKIFLVFNGGATWTVTESPLEDQSVGDQLSNNHAEAKHRESKQTSVSQCGRGQWFLMID